MELYVIEMEFENVHFTLVFTVFYGFVSIHRSIESVGCCADKLRVCPRRKTIFQSSFDMDKNPCFIFPIDTMVSVFFDVLCSRQKCHNLLENHGRNDIRSFFKLHIQSGFLKESLGGSAPFVFSRCNFNAFRTESSPGFLWI